MKVSTQQEAAAWEHQNRNRVVKWTSEWDVNPGYKTVTFFTKDDDRSKETAEAVFVLSLVEEDLEGDAVFREEKLAETMDFVRLGYMALPKGTVMSWMGKGTPAYEKLGNEKWDWWVSLDSTYVVESTKMVKNARTGKMEEEKVYTARPETEKPLYNDNGHLNRWGFRWTDAQVVKHYSSFMTFQLPNY